MVTQYLEITLKRKGLPKIVEAVREDSGRTLQCKITDATIPTSASATIYALKPSGAEVYNTCTVSDNIVCVDLTTQLLAEEGITKCQVVLTQSKQTVTSFEFFIHVYENVMSESAIESSNEYTALQNAIAEAGSQYILSPTKTIGSEVDLNDYTDFGCWLCNNATIAKTLSNTPITNAGFTLRVLRGTSGAYRVQQITSYMGKIYVRWYNGSAWSEWTNCVDVSDETIAAFTALGFSK